MDNQHKKITGYRDLTQAEIDAMNKIKAVAEQVGDLCLMVDGLDDVDLRWVSIGKADLQQGFMALTRAVARPTTF